MKRYRHIFFDLDHTLWDFTANSRATLAELYDELALDQEGVPSAHEFIAAYEEVNRDLWGLYEKGRMPREVMRVLRFRTTLSRFGARPRGLPGLLSSEYLKRCPLRTVLHDGALRLLCDLRPHYRLHIITNGFDEVQHTKLRSSGIEGFFDAVVTSERAGAGKPSQVIFEYAQRASGSRPEESLMVGDNALSDMLGARQAGWDQAHFMPETDPDPEATYRIGHMDELRGLLL